MPLPHRLAPLLRQIPRRPPARSLAALPAQAGARHDHTRPSLTTSLADPATALHHRQIDVVVRDGNKREKRALRREGLWIPSCLQGRGKVPDVQLCVPVAPLLEDLLAGYYALQSRGKIKWSGPLYELRFVGESDAAPLPVDRLRVKSHNMELHPLTDVPRTAAFLYCPEHEPVRVRIPIRYINRDKAPGLKEGGWLNRIIPYIDVSVAPRTKAPLFATLDVAGMRIKDRRRITDVQFEGKGNGCRPVLADDIVTTVVSKV